jgi:hypothetical protein
MTTKRFLDDGAPIKTRISILKGNQNVKFTNPEKMFGVMLAPDTLGRIHSHRKDAYTVWLLEGPSSQTIILEVPLHLMGQYFMPHQHDIFPHFA